MRRKQGWAVIGIVISGLLAGILALSSSGASAAWLLTPTPTPAEIVLFQDDFETYSNRWIESRSPKSSALYGDGGLNFRVVSPGARLWSRPDFATPLDAYHIQARFIFYDGSLDSFMGLVLGYQDEDNFYALTVSPQGEWRFEQHEQEDWIDLTPPDALPVTLPDDQATIWLQAEVSAESVILTVNDSLAGTIPLEGTLSGEFGAIVRAGHGFADVALEDMIVTYPAEESGS
jgi:hypothetical protein